tara:strand:+ start:78 stop:419 length:342 start_codon:yes stop_codon:yes gene_type:complete
MRFNIVPKKLELINAGAYRDARFAIGSDLELCQISADKIISKYAETLWERYGVLFVAGYDSESRRNDNAKREGELVGEYTRRISKGGYRRGYDAIRDVTDSTAWRRYGIAGTK